MHFNLSLRARIVVALLLVVTLISGGYFYAVYELVELLENDLMEGTVKRELREYARRYSSAPDTPPPNSAGLKSYVVQKGESPPSDFPAWLQSWPVGRYDSFQLGEEEFYVGREDAGNAQIYLVLDIENVERLEANLTRLALLILVAAWVAAVAAGVLLSRRVMKPVSKLAERISALRPPDTKYRLQDEFEDREIHLIAVAFDSYRERIEEFVDRERAFTDEASHELRTPLSVVLSAVQLLQEEPTLSERDRERVARIGRATRQMQDLVEALLFLAREDGGWKAEPCALDEVLEGVADTYRSALADRALSLHCEIASPRTILVPRGMAECVVSNLVANAVRHTERGRIDLRLEADRIVVQDTGGGIPPGDVGHIFDRRYRDSQSRGLGLGLYLVKRICDRLGWRIQVRSAPGAGTRFDVTFAPIS